jgi:hypothetical protein
MPANERRFWPRPEVHHHVLGEVVNVYIGQTRVRALALYETSLERDRYPDTLPVLRGKLIGDMDEIACTICGQPVVDWHIGEDAMEILISRVIGGA